MSIFQKNVNANLLTSNSITKSNIKPKRLSQDAQFGSVPLVLLKGQTLLGEATEVLPLGLELPKFEYEQEASQK